MLSLCYSRQGLAALMLILANGMPSAAFAQQPPRASAASEAAGPVVLIDPAALSDEELAVFVTAIARLKPERAWTLTVQGRQPLGLINQQYVIPTAYPRQRPRS